MCLARLHHSLVNLFYVAIKNLLTYLLAYLLTYLLTYVQPGVHTETLLYEVRLSHSQQIFSNIHKIRTECVLFHHWVAIIIIINNLTVAY